jgi:hypothetical protein
VIRRAKPDDIPALVIMGRENYRAIHGTDAGYSPDAAARFLRNVIFPQGAVFMTRGGMIGGVLCPRWHAPGFVEAVEMMWFAADGSGGFLLRRFCKWARRQNAQPVITSTTMPERLAQRLGLKASETMWRG